MNEIHKCIKKRRQLWDDNFSHGFLYYCMKVKYDNGCLLEQILYIADEIKKDFPDITNKHIAVDLSKKGKIILFFFSFKIPKDMQFETFEE